ncbi:FAD-dependent oxidoreductase [Pseudoclavibacter terrae]|uniref:FAD-dependent oxidoreductase n=1 Tax=Pseudoclavibacter terrae TaxID=1530195 RepID=UPI002330BF32|nr:FAD-dependent oxidoreductase [Pseudoclavibacter terrae]
MDPRSAEPNAAAVLDTYRLDAGLNVFAIGLSDSSVTVLSQQTRALNLAWALTETGIVNIDSTTRIAIIGAGFAGLTVAAGLISKEANVEVTLLEQRDSVLPLQHGNDTRWLHPHIYEWPRDGSSAHSAGLPVLNWTAARASDVVVQVKTAWEDLEKDAGYAKVRLFCNTAPVKVDVQEQSGRTALAAEWIGQQRKTWKPSVPEGNRPQRGLREEFDVIILAVGFGVETDGAMSYWRNETLAQPALRRRRRTYVVSGAGDGGWIDLFRIRISDFRQDRILGELFGRQPALLSALQGVQQTAIEGVSVISELRRVWSEHPDEGERVIADMDERLRHDTDAILHLRSNGDFESLFNRRVSFQNQLLGWVLYASGGFSIWHGEMDHLIQEEHVSDNAVVIRHGPRPDLGIKRVLGPALQARLEKGKSTSERFGSTSPQSTKNYWLPGYFGTTLRPANEETKKYWRREYLPPSTEIVSATLCGAIAGALSLEHPERERLRITLHRVVQIGDSLVFQQCCDYNGSQVSNERMTAGRTFPLTLATIGHAYLTSKIVRSRPGADTKDLQSDMLVAHLTKDAREMSGEVTSVLALPLLGIAEGSNTNPVVAVLYIDSDVRDFFGDTDRIRRIAQMCVGSLDAVSAELQRTRAVSNTAFPVSAPPLHSSETPSPKPSLEVLDSEPIPQVQLRRLNLDQTTFLETESP